MANHAHSGIEAKLLHAVTQYDRKQAKKAENNPRAYYNHYALPQYLGRVQDVIADVARGADLESAILAGFTPGPLRNACLKAIGAQSNSKESHGQFMGMPVYRPITDR